MMVKILLALRTSGNGSTMGKLSREHEQHSRLIHYIFRFDAFQSSIVKVTKDWPEPYSLADAHLNLIVTIVSANSTYILPAINMLWKQIEVTPPDIPDDTKKKTDNQTTTRTWRMMVIRHRRRHILLWRMMIMAMRIAHT